MVRDKEILYRFLDAADSAKDAPRIVRLEPGRRRRYISAH